MCNETKMFVRDDISKIKRVKKREFGPKGRLVSEHKSNFIFVNKKGHIFKEGGLEY